MTHIRLLILLSVLVVLLAVAAIVYLPASEYSAMGSIFAAAGSILAVIWFSAGLFYQSMQLQEQRQQFMSQFEYLREDSRRSALSIAKDILWEAEGAALKQNSSLKSISDLAGIYTANFVAMKVILESKNPTEVIDGAERWMTTEGPAGTILAGIKNAAEVYFRAIGKTDIDYTKEMDEFVYIYGPHLWKLPYFSKYQVVANMVSEFMIIIEPGRKACLLAYSVALLKTAPPRWVKKEKVLENIERHRQAGLPIPAIAEDLIKT